MSLGVMSATGATPAADTTAAEVAAPREAEATTQATPEPEPAETADPTPARADYAGRVKGNGALMAVSIRKGKAIGYFCDGKIEAWFAGTAKNGKVALKGFGDATATARLGGGKASGDVELHGKKWSFVAPAVKKPSGLYRASAIVRGARIKAGWIVLDNGYQVGYAAADDRQIPTPTLRPGTDPTIDGTRVDAKDVDEFIEELS
ncbi:hypothetical protein GCM10023259_081100 [Thermocatellispora tengchongensis]